MNGIPSQRAATIAVVLIAAAKFILHMVFNGSYDFFRDEFYYIASGEHLDWGFVDHPPLIPLIANCSRMLFGDSLRAIRFVPAVASSVIVIQGAAIARLMGGGWFARILTALCIAGAPMYLSDGGMLTTNSLEPLLWMGCAYYAIRAVKEDDPKYWLWFGIIGGIGLQEKYSMGVFLVGITAGLLLTSARPWLMHQVFWIGAALALLVFLPNVIWNENHNWPFLEVMRNLKITGRDVVLSPIRYFIEQWLLIHPLTAPIWIAGLAGLFFWKRLSPYRFLAWAYVAVFAFFVISRGKNYYVAPIYPMLLAAGAIATEQLFARPRLNWLRPLSLLTIFVAQLALLPIIVPILPIERLGAYLDSLPFAVPRSEVNHLRVALPQHYADQFGWRELVELVGRGWRQIPESERSDCAIFAQNYGEAGAIDFFGARYGLPPAISGHLNYYLWGPRNYSGNCMLVIGDRKEVLESKFDQVEYSGTTDAPYAVQNHIPVFLCRRPKFGALAAVWPELKTWR